MTFLAYVIFLFFSLCSSINAMDLAHTTNGTCLVRWHTPYLEKTGIKFEHQLISLPKEKICGAHNIKIKLEVDRPKIKKSVVKKDKKNSMRVSDQLRLEQNKLQARVKNKVNTEFDTVFFTFIKELDFFTPLTLDSVRQYALEATKIACEYDKKQKDSLINKWAHEERCCARSDNAFMLSGKVFQGLRKALRKNKGFKLSQALHGLNEEYLLNVFFKHLNDGIVKDCDRIKNSDVNNNNITIQKTRFDHLFPLIMVVAIFFVVLGHVLPQSFCR